MILIWNCRLIFFMLKIFFTIFYLLVILSLFIFLETVFTGNEYKASSLSNINYILLLLVVCPQRKSYTGWMINSFLFHVTDWVQVTMFVDLWSNHFAVQHIKDVRSMGHDSQNKQWSYRDAGSPICLLLMLYLARNVGWCHWCFF